jgi:hypothetical protein
MRIDNKKRALRLRKIFFIGSFIIVGGATVLFFLIDIILASIISAGLFSLWFIFFRVADYQVIEFKNENNRILLRYYKAITFTRPKYNEIEFPVDVLGKAVFEDSMFGKLSDVTLLIKTKKGVAEYPSVSLSALSYEDRQKLASSLNTRFQKSN